LLVSFTILSKSVESFLILHFFFAKMKIPKLHRYTSLVSTNKTARECVLKGAVHGETIVAEHQSRGRGRLGKSWQSPAGKGLCFTIILQPQNLKTEDFSKITLAAGLAVAKQLELITSLKVFLKWPNDVYINEKKCCGILAETVTGKNTAKPSIVLGVGVNISTEKDDFPEEIRNSATSLYLETGIHYPPMKILEALHYEIMVQCDRLENKGVSNILQEWRKRDFLIGKKLNWLTNAGTVITGISEGPDEDGHLMVRDAEGRLFEVISGDISLAEQIKQGR